jgi:hypothetical protein
MLDNIARIYFNIRPQPSGLQGMLQGILGGGAFGGGAPRISETKSS